MKIAVVAANGKEGRLVVEEAVRRGHDVTAVVRGENKSKAQHAIVKDLFDLAAADLAGSDVVVDAFGVWAPEDQPQHSTSLKTLCGALSGTATRLIVVGGAGSLYADAEHKTQVKDLPTFPEAFLPLANGMGKALEELRERSDVKWAYISPAVDFQAEGKRTGSYEMAGEEFTVNAEGKSFISYADYAIAMVDEAESGRHVGKRISVYTK